MRILLVNDDGIYAPGLHACWRALSLAGHDVFTCVPDRPRSATGHAITMHKPLRVNPVATAEGTAYVSNGTPADCVPLALLQLMDQQPDLVVSGINAGPNLGDDVIYSGTVAGAMEAVLNGVPGMAISVAAWEDARFELAAACCVQLAPMVPRLNLPPDTFLNVNVPNVDAATCRGFRVTTQGSRRYKGDIKRYEAPYAGVYYWRGGEVVDRSESEDTDILAVAQNYVAVTPLHLDLTRRDALALVQDELRRGDMLTGE